MFFLAKIDVTIEEKKEEIAAKWRETNAQMRVFPINKLNYKTRYPAVSDKIETLLANLLILYYELFDKIVDEDEMKAEQQRCTHQEDEIKKFLIKLEEHYYELEAEEASKDKASVPVVVKSIASFEQVMKEQLEDSRRREEEKKQAKSEKEKITKERTEANFHVELEGLKKKAELVSSPVTKIPLGTWKNVEEDEAEKLKQRRNDLIAQRAEAGIILDDIPGCLDTRQAVNRAADSVHEVNDELRSEDTK